MIAPLLADLIKAGHIEEDDGCKVVKLKGFKVGWDYSDSPDSSEIRRRLQLRLDRHRSHPSQNVWS